MKLGRHFVHDYDDDDDDDDVILSLQFTQLINTRYYTTKFKVRANSHLSSLKLGV